MTTGETRTDIINALERLDVAKMSPAQRRVFRTNGLNFLEYLLAVDTAIKNRREKPAIAYEALFQQTASIEYHLNL